MFKRVRWMVVGMGVGAGAQLWARRKVAHLAKRYSPPQVAGRAAMTARSEIKAAIDEGRTAMRRREAELRGTPPTADTTADPTPVARNGRNRPPTSH